jgi:hypothetical protein
MARIVLQGPMSAGITKWSIFGMIVMILVKEPMELIFVAIFILKTG